MKYVLDYYGAVKYARTVCANSNMRVEFHETGTLATPFTTGDAIHIEQPDAMWTKKEWDRWFYRLYHELGHEHEVNCAPHWKTVMMEKGTNKPSILSSMVNLVSDHIQEHNRLGEFKGVDRVLLEGRAEFVREHLLSDEALDTPSQGVNHDIFVAAAIFDTIQRGKWNPLLRGIGEAALARCGDDREDMVKTLIDSGIDITAGKNEWDSYEIAKAILEALGEDVEAMEEALSEEGEGEPGEGEGAQAYGHGDSPAGDGTDGDTGVSAGELSEEEAEAIGKAFDHDHTKVAEHDAFAGEGDDPRFDTSGARPRDRWVVRDPIVVDIPNDIYPVVDGTRDRLALRFRATRFVDDGVKVITRYTRPSILAKKLRNLIISKRASRTEHGFKSGRISRKHLWRANKQMAATDVYCQKTSEITKASAVTILVDASTSMRGPKYGISNRAAIVLQQALQKAQVPVEVLEFSESIEGPINIIVKPFSEVNVSEQEITRRCGICYGLLGMNSDGESLLWAYNRLVRQEAPRKVLIVLSDGQPCADGGSMRAAQDYLKFVCEGIEATPVELYGVGVETDAVKDFYKDYCVINDAEDLEATLLEIVKKKVVR